MRTTTPPDRQPLLRFEAMRRRRAEALRSSRELRRLVEGGDLLGLAVLFVAGIALATLLAGMGPDPSAMVAADPVTAAVMAP